MARNILDAFERERTKAVGVYVNFLVQHPAATEWPDFGTNQYNNIFTPPDEKKLGVLVSPSKVMNISSNHETYYLAVRQGKLIPHIFFA